MDSRNRLWWVIGGVGLLLVVVLTGGLFWLSPVDSAAPVDDLALPPRQQGTAAFEYVAGQAASGADGQAATAAGAGARDTQAAFTGGAVAVASSDGAEPTAPAARAVPRITVDQPAPATVAAAPAVRAIPTSSARTTPAPAAARTPAAASPRPEPVAVRAVPAPAALTPAAALQEFWVQVGSFASRKRADDLGQRLSDQGIVSRVTTRNSGAEVFFRVRVGPYASRAEAEKFLAWVKRVDGLDGSYIAAVRNAGG